MIDYNLVDKHYELLSSISESIKKYLILNEMSVEEFLNSCEIEEEVFNKWMSKKHSFSVKELIILKYKIGIEIEI